MTNEEGIKILESMKTDLYGLGVDENNIVFGIDIKAINLAIKALKERPQGEWKHEVIGDKPCVLCNQCFLHFDCESNFCPNCGADMTDDADMSKQHESI